MAFKVICSSTVLLPAWRKILEDLKMLVTLMVYNVATQWNYTLNMLAYTLKHKEAVDTLMQHQDLCQYELSNGEWETRQQLYNALKVS